MLRTRSVLLAVAAAGAAAGASADTYTWPGASPCHLTLQVCINSIETGDTIEIATAGPIDENVSAYRSLVLRAAPGYKPAFAPGRYLSAGVAIVTGEPINVTFEGLTVTDADVTMYRNDPGDASFVVRRMRVLTNNPAQRAVIRVNGNNAGNLVVDIAENEVSSRSNSSANPAVALHVNGATATGRIRFNRVSSFGSSNAPGISITAPAGTLEVDVFANEVRGDFGGGGIYVANFTATTGSAAGPVTARLVNNAVIGPGRYAGGFGNGARVLVGNADIDVAVANNTVTGTTEGLAFHRTSGAATGNITGTVRNNLVAFNAGGLQLGDGTGALTNSYNLVFGNEADIYTPGAGTVTADPRLESIAHPRLSAGSPALDAADTVYVQLLLGLNGLPQVDLDGMRRTIGGGSLGVDIGAYEFGDESLVASKATGTGNNFTMFHPALDSRPTARPVLTKNFRENRTENPFAIGTWYTGSFWAAFNQSLSQTMPAGTAMNVFVPGVGGSFGASYAHVATVANTSGHVTTLDQTFLNTSPDAIVLATSNWNASGSGVYNDHHIAVGYFGSWFVLNQDFAAMPDNAAFNIYAQDPSPNAWVHTVATHNRPSTNQTNLDHPLLNGVPCAQVHVTQRATTLNDHPYDVDYVSGRWRIYNQDVGEMPLGSEFNVLVNPRQVFECLDVIFEDGFDG
jgi:hypothetical protein